ncbi:hypothetical protein [Streptomyces sp. PR69]|uniref:hypothetical protein n=1 Tax=Streptomyces sp. PR69 TaxID=2984950 RepID=UPI0022643EAB|nr:hypothetical protein [Streptomyces sp. PR69]
MSARNKIHKLLNDAGLRDREVYDLLDEYDDEQDTAQPAEQTIYRAGFHGSDIALGHYTTAAAARAHCEVQLSREYPPHVALLHDWIRDDDPHAPWELVATADGGPEEPTGYVVTPLLVKAAYDEEADA